MAVDLSAYTPHVNIEVLDGLGLAFSNDFKNVLMQDTDGTFKILNGQGATVVEALKMDSSAIYTRLPFAGRGGSAYNPGTPSYQDFGIDLLITGTGLGHTGGYLGPIMGNLKDANAGVTAAGNNASTTFGVAGKYTLISSAYTPGYPRAGVVGEMAGRNGDAAVMAVISEGDLNDVLGGGWTQAVRAFFGVDWQSGKSGTAAVQFGLDIMGETHDVYTSAVSYSDGDIRRPNRVLHMQGSSNPTNGVSGTGANKAGVGSQYTNILSGETFLQCGTIASPTWKAITHA